MLSKLEEGQNVATVLRLPRNDRFGLTDIFVDRTMASEHIELWLSHSFLRACDQNLKPEAEDLLGRDVDDENPTPAELDLQKLLEKE
jgi:hypothetical protein